MAASYAYRASSTFHAEKVPGAFMSALIEITADNSYPAGGYPFSIANLNTLSGGAYSTIDAVDVVNPWINTAANGTAYMAGFDKANNKVHAFAQAVAGGGTAQVDVTAATPLTGFVCTLRVWFC